MFVLKKEADVTVDDFSSYTFGKKYPLLNSKKIHQWSVKKFEK